MRPETLTTMSRLAKLYERQGRLTEASDLHIDTVEARARVLGATP